MSRKVISFAVNDAIFMAWNQLWQEKEKQRAKPSSWRGSEGFYITRQEIIRKVRAYAYADMKGLPRAEADDDYGVRLNFNLDAAVCSWLSGMERQGIIEGHAFGRHTITGRRYRPKGSDLSPVEKKTLEKKTNRTPYEERQVHLSARRNSSYYLRPLCIKPKKRTSYRATKPSNARMTDERDKVTCPSCLRLMAEQVTKYAVTMRNEDGTQWLGPEEDTWEFEKSNIKFFDTREAAQAVADKLNVDPSDFRGTCEVRQELVWDRSP